MRLSSIFTTLISSVSALSLPRDGSQVQTGVEVVTALFDGQLKDYLGKWYQVAGTPFSRTEGARCVPAEYKLNPNGTVAVINTGLVGSQQIGNNGTRTPVDKKYGGEGRFRVQFPGFPAPACLGPSYIFDAEHSIVQTSNWGVLFVLARERSPPTDKVDAWIERAVCLGTKKENIVKFDQTNC
ncbi:Calycin-like protein [Lophiotrema nucula]|uniref:Calycin-like protein n=1 Tax=Lophiotrema nucula TaxID=690887 RepID=A0A6A5ZUV6_9PLEO|nr:Calycin-like protein [Lophiotrema nucula]